jgi:hypothetical protein
MLLIAQLRQSAKIFSHRKDEIPSPSTVAAGWSAHGNIFFTPKGNTTVSALARTYFNYRFICKFIQNYQPIQINSSDRNDKTTLARSSPDLKH